MTKQQAISKTKQRLKELANKTMEEANNSTWLRCQGEGCNFMTQNSKQLSSKYGLCMSCLERAYDIGMTALLRWE